MRLWLVLAGRSLVALEPGSLSGQVVGPVNTALWLHARVGYCRRSSANGGKAKRANCRIDALASGVVCRWNGRVMMRWRNLVGEHGRLGRIELNDGGGWEAPSRGSVEGS